MLRTWLAATVGGLLITAAAHTQDATEGEALAAGFVADFQAELVDGSRVHLADPDALAARLGQGFNALSDLAEEMDADWGASIGFDVQGVTRTEEERSAGLTDEDRMPPPDSQCAHYDLVAPSADSTVLAQWRRCFEIEEDEETEGRFNTITFAELLYGEDGNFRSLRLGIALSTTRLDYAEATRSITLDMLDASMEAVVADSLDD